MRLAVVFAVVLGGCAAVPAPEQPSPVEEQAPTTSPEAQKPSENIAVAGLMETARADVAANRLGAAAATLERALRIEPRNARLWHELALLRLKQGDYAQAASTAARSNMLAGDDSGLRAANQRVIAEAHAARR